MTAQAGAGGKSNYPSSGEQRDERRGCYAGSGEEGRCAELGHGESESKDPEDTTGGVK